MGPTAGTETCLVFWIWIYETKVAYSICLVFSFCTTNISWHL